MKLFDLRFRTAVEAFSRAKHAEAAKADELDGLEYERERLRHSRREALSEPTTPSTLILRDLIERTLETRIGRVRGELGTLAVEAERLRLDLVDAAARVRAQEALDEKRRAEASVHAGRREQAALDDIRTSAR